MRASIALIDDEGNVEITFSDPMFVKNVAEGENLLDELKKALSVEIKASEDSN